MNTRMCPINRAFDMPVFHRIVMNIIHMPFVIVFITNHVLPIPPLPDSTLTLANPAFGALFATWNAT